MLVGEVSCGLSVDAVAGNVSEADVTESFDRRLEERDSRVGREVSSSGASRGVAVETYYMFSFRWSKREMGVGALTKRLFRKNVARVVIDDASNRKTPSHCAAFPAPRLLRRGRGA